MKFQALFFLLLLTSMYLSLAQGSYGNCCLGYVRLMKASTKRHIENYRMQETDGDCNIRAVVFLIRKKATQKYKRQRSICANPQDGWVQDILKNLNTRIKK
uniref:CC chemokine n=1 Tax=Rachycentron canadum TaxID=141264 RepID=G8F0V6_RACCA|nr:CC chemokine [Rachycentron canadum]